MKILIIDTYYQAFLNKFYKQFPQIKNFSYDKTVNKLMGQFFGTANFYSKYLIELGHDAKDVVSNDKILQRKWANEKDEMRLLDWADGIHIPFTKIGFHSSWLEEILEKQIYEYKPDVIYCQNLGVPGVLFLNKIKKTLPTFVIGQIASPVTFNKESLSCYDLILTSFPHFVPRFKNIGIKSELFKIGFGEPILDRLKKLKRQYLVSFVGGFSRNHNNETVCSVATDIWGYGRVPETPKYHGEAWGIDMYNILHNSKIALNRHIATAENHANNMRLYEATGVGAMLITDYKSDLKDIFIPGKEVETYKTEDELKEKVAYYLSHDREREAVAQAGQKRTLKDHTYKKRMIELVSILKRHI